MYGYLCTELQMVKVILRIQLSNYYLTVASDSLEDLAHQFYLEDF